MTFGPLYRRESLLGKTGNAAQDTADRFLFTEKGTELCSAARGRSKAGDGHTDRPEHHAVLDTQFFHYCEQHLIERAVGPIFLRFQNRKRRPAALQGMTQRWTCSFYEYRALDHSPGAFQGNSLFPEDRKEFRSGAGLAPRQRGGRCFPYGWPGGARAPPS